MATKFPNYPLTEMEIQELDLNEGCGRVTLLVGIFEIHGRGKNGWSCLSIEAVAPNDRRAPVPSVFRGWIIDQINGPQRDVVWETVQDHIAAEDISPSDHDTNDHGELTASAGYRAAQIALSDKSDRLNAGA